MGRTVAEFLAPGLLERLPAIVIATPDNRTMIARELGARGVNVHQLEQDGDLQMLDADETLARFMVGSEPDPVRFHATVDQLIARACKDRLPCPVRAYGEMVDVLWKRANRRGRHSPRNALEPSRDAGAVLTALRVCGGQFLQRN